MANRWLRFGIALLALTAATAAGFRIVQQEQRLTADVAATSAADVSAETAAVTVAEIKAALHAYVAEGQGHAFWTARAGMLIDRLRASVLELEAPAAAAATPLTEALDLVDQIAAAEARAEDYVRSGQHLMAGDVIFTESRDLLDAVRLQLGRARTTINQHGASTRAEIRREQALLALGAAGVLAFAMLLLVIPGRSATAAPAAMTVEPADQFGSSARLISRASAPQQTAAASAAAQRAQADKTADKPGAPSAAGAGAAVSLRDAAGVCTDLGRASQAVEIETLLKRAAAVLNASGVIVWMATPGGHELFPAASAGYDERLLARIGTIRRDATNVTAGAFREATPKTTAGGGHSGAALAVPLMTPLGPAGVLSAELSEPAAVDEARLAVAVIFAAQLASLVGSIGAREDAAPPAKAQA